MPQSDRSLGRTWTALLALGTAATAAYGFLPHASTLELILVDGVVALAALAAVSGWRRAPDEESAAWLCTSLAAVGFLAGELTRRGFPAAGIGPFHRLSDALLLLACLPLAAAATLLASAREGDHDRSASLDAGILTAVAGVVLWDTLMGSIAGDPSRGTLSKVVGIGHPLAYLVAIGLVLRLVLSRNARDRSAVSFAGGAAVLLVTQLVLFGLNDTTSARLEEAIAPVLLLSYLLIGFAALHPSEVRTLQFRAPRALGRARIAVVLVAMLTPAAVLARELSRNRLVGLNTVTVAACASVLVIAVAAVRLFRLFEARLSALIFHSADAIFLVDRDYRIAFASPSTDDLWARASRPQIGTSVVDSFVEEHREAVGRQLDNLAGMPMGATLPLEGVVRAEGGQLRMLEGTGRNLLEDRNVRAMVVTMRDTTARRELEKQLKRRAFHDDLTGLANRALFTDRLEHALDRSARHQDVKIAVLFIDLDDFKAVNDGMGHGAGDELIRSVAERIRSCVRPADTVARIGGDEFAVLVEDVPSVAHGTSLAQRLLEVLQLPVGVTGVSLAVPASVGVTFANRESTAESLLRDADIAMYSAKSQGKARVTVFDASLREDAVQRLALRVELPEALRAAQFHLDYQPIKDVGTLELRGFEALIRWHHPQRGLVSPAEFIPAAEETGTIVEIGRWVLEEACRQAVVWNTKWAAPLSMSVNVSGLQLLQPGFTEDLRLILENTGLEPSLLIIELTESVLVRHQRVEHILGDLRTIGVGIAIDDFGTGYSSLSYLQEFPVTSIKVDRSFVADLAGGEVGLVRSILSIGEALGLTTVAEGVETAEQLEVLARLGCDRAQGFYLDRPQSPGAIDGMLEVERMARTAQWRVSSGAPPG